MCIEFTWRKSLNSVVYSCQLSVGTERAKVLDFKKFVANGCWENYKFARDVFTSGISIVLITKIIIFEIVPLHVPRTGQSNDHGDQMYAKPVAGSRHIGKFSGSQWRGAVQSNIVVQLCCRILTDWPSKISANSQYASAVALNFRHFVYIILLN